MYYDKTLQEMKTVAEEAKANKIPAQEFLKVITPGRVLALISLLKFAEEDIDHLNRTTQTSDIGLYQLASLFGDNTANIPENYIFDVVDKVKALLGRNVSPI